MGDRRGHELREPSGARAKVPRVVDEPGVLGFLLDGTCTRLLKPARKLGAPAHSIHDEVRVQLLTRLGPHAGDVGSAVVPTDDEAADGDAAAYLDLGFGCESQGSLEHRAAGGDCLEAFVSVAWCAVRDRRRHHAQQIEPDPAGRLERWNDVRQLLLEDYPA